MNKDSILERTLAAARADRPTVSPGGQHLARVTEGVIIRDIPTHVDERGSVAELIDLRWDSLPDPLVFAYTFTVRPGIVKGWGLHERHEDRYVLLKGEMELVLFDVRPDSPTCNEIFRIFLSEHRRQMINIPKFVWHADYNEGTCDALVVNFPTAPYNHGNPDKHRLPFDTPLIPYSFKDARGGG